MENQNNITSTDSTSNTAKFAFFYLLSLVALVFMAVSTGMVAFQIINKYIHDVISQYSGRFSDEQLKFAISALIISTPIFYVLSSIIYKNLFRGKLGKDSGVRRWLTYFILLVSSVVMISWAIAIINGFLGGELTTKFILKALTALVIAAAIFSFYLYDIRRTEVVGKKSTVTRIYFIISLLVVLAAFVTSLFVVESPYATRNRKIDEEVIKNFSIIDNCVSQYYKEKEALPDDMDVAVSNCPYTFTERLENQIKDKEIEYRKGSDKNYQLCAHFKTSNKEDDKSYMEPPLKSNLHEAGWQCLDRKALEFEGEGTPIRLYD